MNISNQAYHKLNNTLLLLKVSYGLFFITVGIDKYLNYIVDWQKYIYPGVLEIVQVEPSLLNRGFGAIEIICGLLLLTQWARISASLVTLALLGVATNLAFLGYLDIAARDVLLAVGAITIVLLSGVEEEIKA